MLATGGTLIGATQLIEKCDGTVNNVVLLLEIPELKGADNFSKEFPKSKVKVLF